MTTRWGVNYNDLEDEHGLPRGTLYAVEMTESRGNPEAVSPAGATGAFQFMPATAKEMQIDPYDPAQSAQGAARYLGRLARQFNGDIGKALAAYNAGPGRVAKGGVLPRETREYVPKVFARMAESDDGLESLIYGGSSAPSSGLDDDALFGAVYGEPPQKPQEAPAVPSVDDDDLEASIYGTAPVGRSPDVPAGTGEPGYMGNRDPDVPPGVGEPGYSPPATGRPPLSDFTNEDVVGAGWKLLPPRARDDLEPVIRGFTAPVRADQENLAALVPGVPQPSRAPGEESDPRYITGNIASGVMVPGLGPATIPRAIASGVMGATMQPTPGGGYLQDKATQAGLGAMAGGVTGAIGRGVGKALGAVRGQYADPGIQELADLAKRHGVPVTADDLARARTNPTVFTQLQDWIMRRAEHRLEGIPLVGLDRAAQRAASLDATKQAVNRGGDAVHDLVAAKVDTPMAQAMVPVVHAADSSPEALQATAARLLEWAPNEPEVQGLAKLVDHIAKAPGSKVGGEANRILALALAFIDVPSTIAAGIGGRVAFTTEAGKRLLFSANRADEKGMAEIVHQLSRMAGGAAGRVEPYHPEDIDGAPAATDDQLYQQIYGGQQ